MIIAGCLGIAVAITLTAWAFHDVGKLNAFGATVQQITIVAGAGVTPTLISLLVIAAGVHLWTKSIDLVASVQGQRLDLDDYERPRS